MPYDDVRNLAALLDDAMETVLEAHHQQKFFARQRAERGLLSLKEFKAKVEKMPHAKQLLSAEDYEAYQAESDAIHQEFWAAAPHKEVETP